MRLVASRCLLLEKGEVVDEGKVVCYPTRGHELNKAGLNVDARGGKLTRTATTSR